ncbi:MAG: CapA family protein [Kiritimatiellia bacterium]|nr:CapA family protein [Lentisphaerota bacterium]
MTVAAKWDQPDWVAGRWNRRAAGACAVRVAFAADWAPIRRFAPIMAATPEAVYGDLLPLLLRNDLRIFNLECPLTNCARPVVKSGSVLKGLPIHIQALQAASCDVVTMANNHVLDYGSAGLRETLQLLDDNAIRHVGAGMNPRQANRPLLGKVKGVRLAVLNFSEGEDLTAARAGPGVAGWQPARILARIRQLRAEVDFLAVVCHAGLEYVPCPPPYLVETMQRLAAAGADLVIGHHPHVPQGIQIHNGVPLCYSLGNFVFYQETGLLYRRLGYLLLAEISKHGLDGFSIVPYAITEDGLALLPPARRADFFDALRRVSEPLASAEGRMSAWHGFLRHCGRAGLTREIELIMHTMARDPSKGAAMLRNRMTTLQHNRHWQDLLTRIMDGTLDDAPCWAVELIEEWMTRSR